VASISPASQVNGRIYLSACGVGFFVCEKKKSNRELRPWLLIIKLIIYKSWQKGANRKRGLMNVLHYPVVPVVNDGHTKGYMVINPFTEDSVFLLHSQFKLFKTLVIKMNTTNEDTGLLARKFIDETSSEIYQQLID